MKKIVGIIAAFALVAGTVFADPDVTPVVTSFNGNAQLDYVVDLDNETAGFKNGTWTEFKVQFKNGDWGGKSTSGEGLWGELNIRTEGDTTKDSGDYGTGWNWVCSVGTAKLHFIDGDTYFHMDLLKPNFAIGELQGSVALYNHSWDPVAYMFQGGKNPTDNSYNGFQLNFGVPVIDVSLAFGSKTDAAGNPLKMKDQKYAYKAAATIKPIDGLAIGAAYSSTTEDKAKDALVFNVAYDYAIDDTFYVKPLVDFVKFDKQMDIDAIALFGWGAKNSQWCHDFLAAGSAYVSNSTYATEGVSVRFTKTLKDAAGKTPAVDNTALEIGAYDASLLNKVIPGTTTSFARYTAAGKELGKGELAAGIIYGNKFDIINLTARFTFADNFKTEKTDFAYGLKLNTTEVIQNTDLYIDYVGKKAAKKGVVTIGAKIAF